jgi:pimeloyl-ACP methyl ester carboxylesterase
MTTKRTALISAGVAAGALAAGTIGGIVVKRRHEHAAGEARWELPPQSLGWVESFDGTRIGVHAAGPPEAPVLLFVHGFSLDGTTWFEQWMDLSVDHRCVVMEQRGHGRSGAAAHGDLSLRAMARDVAAVLERVAVDRPSVVVGHSMGAMAILSMAEQRPELFGPRVKGVVLIGAASSDLLGGAMGSITDLVRPRFGSLSAAARRVDRLRRAVLASPTDVGGVVVRLTQFGPDAPRPLVDHVVALAQRASSDLWTRGLAELMETDLRQALPRVTVPALVVVGEHDRVTPPASAVGLAGALPDGRLVVLEGAGHMAMLERPVELDREIRTFARSVLTSEPVHAPRGRGGKSATEVAVEEAEGER